MRKKITFYTDKSIYNLAGPRKIFHTTVIQVCPNATVNLILYMPNKNWVQVFT